MSFGNITPEIDVNFLAEKLKSDEVFVLLDVRELFELDRAKITDSRLMVVPMSRLSTEGVDALPESARLQNAEIYVMCHHGVRSTDVTRWLVS
jgi:rhodanese-related sulfurtransferase